MTLNQLLLIAAAVCFIFAILIATAVVTAAGLGPALAWVAGGLLAYVLSLLFPASVAVVR